MGSFALVEGDSLAYFTVRRVEGGAGRRSELGAIGHSPRRATARRAAV
ncbi:MAG: hypothetical protein ACRDRK_23585 [Pseudonocardia sp.]